MLIGFEILQWIVIIVQSVIIFYLSKFIVEFLNNFRIKDGHVTNEKLKIGEMIPLFRERDQLNREVISAESNKYTLLLFVSNQCMNCKELIPTLPKILKNIDMRIIVISREELDYQKSEMIHFIKSDNLFKNFYVETVPTFVLVDPKNHSVMLETVTSSHELNIILDNYFSRHKLAGKII